MANVIRTVTVAVLILLAGCTVSIDDGSVSVSTPTETTVENHSSATETPTEISTSSTTETDTTTEETTKVVSSTSEPTTETITPTATATETETTTETTSETTTETETTSEDSTWADECELDAMGITQHASDHLDDPEDNETLVYFEVSNGNESPLNVLVVVETSDGRTFERVVYAPALSSSEIQQVDVPGIVPEDEIKIYFDSCEVAS